MTGHSAVGAALATGVGGVPLQAVDLTALSEMSGAVRAVVAFLLVLLLGGTLLWRFEPFVERSVDASMAQPLRSTAYGVAAHVVVVFAGVLLASKLAQYPIAGWNPAGVGLVLGLLVLVLVGSLGFTVVGSTVVELGGQPSRWVGLVVGACLAGGIAVVTPTVAWVAWLVVGSVGIGGAVRRWVNASAHGL
jgi:hypothetical protein